MSGVMLAIAPIKEVLDLDIFNRSLLLILRSKQIVRWKITEERPNAKPKRGACTRNACMTLSIFRVDTTSITSLKSAVWTKMRQNGSKHFYVHASHEPSSQQHSSPYKHVTLLKHRPPFSTTLYILLRYLTSINGRL